LFGFIGDLRLALIAQVLAFAGVTALGLFTPPFAVMLIFLFINSMGMHLFMPLQDAIGMSLAEPHQIGRRMGQYSSVRSAFGLIAALLVFFGFRSGFFSFQTEIKWIFIVSAAFFLFAVWTAFAMAGKGRPVKARPGKLKLVFRKQYKYYYFLTVLHGVQKQIAYVYGTWLIVDLLMKKADTIALLSIVVGFISIFFLNLVGKWMDRFGIRKMMFIEAFAFIFVYILYGLAAWGITAELYPSQGLAVGAVYLLFIIDRLSMQMGMVRSVYLRSIAWDENEVTAALSTGVSLDHIVSILAAVTGGFIWSRWGSHWVFFLAALFSLGNLYVAIRVRPAEEKEAAEKMRLSLKESQSVH
jgi:MFS family permease